MNFYKVGTRSKKTRQQHSREEFNLQQANQTLENIKAQQREVIAQMN